MPKRKQRIPPIDLQDWVEADQALRELGQAEAASLAIHRHCMNGRDGVWG